MAFLGMGNGFSIWALGLKPKISNPFFEGWCDIANSIGSRYEPIHSFKPYIIIRVTGIINL